MTSPNMIGSNLVHNFVDKRRATSVAGDSKTHNIIRSIAPFTCNGAGSTTTMVGANAAPQTNDNNVVRRGEEFQLFTAAGAKKEETVFTVTGVAVAGSTTVTFTPAAAVATANTDFARFVGMTDLKDIADLDARLLVIGYTQTQINVMTVNDKVFAIRQSDNADGI